MPTGNKPAYNAFVSRKGSDNKAFYTRVGAAWNVGADGISVKLKPGIAIVGDMVLFPFKEVD